MTIKILASLAIAATMFTACSDSATTPPPSKANQCAAGLSAECVMGTWSLNGPTVQINYGADVITTIDPSHNFEGSPATLRFFVDEKQANKFHFANSTLSKSSCKFTNIYGNWNIVGSSIHLYANIGNDCMAVNEATIPVEISTAGGNVTMTFKQIFFMEPEIKESDAVEKNTATEVYNFVSAD